MFEFLGEFEEIAGDLYPYRWPISIAAVAFAAAVVALALRMRWHRALWEHRVLTAAVAVPLFVAAALFGTYTLPPLWERSRLDEASPLASAPTVAAATAGATPAAAATPPGDGGSMPAGGSATFMARVTHHGMFQGADDFHFGRGDAILIETSPQTFTLRFENFSVRNGPDLFVYLSNDPDDVSDAVNLGDLKATDGNFNYEIPADVDPASYRYAIVWCRDFAVLFASAALEMA
ncbi:MAG: DM13 domain-containing protein [Dehalococcoidia bacterium]